MTASTNILLLDSEPMLREATALLLRRSGGRVRVATSTAEAVEAARARAFDVAVLDVSGRDGSAADVRAALRAAGCEPPRVVVCTDLARAVAAACDDAEVLCKPYPFARLLRAVFGVQAAGRASKAPPRRVPTPRRRTRRAPPDWARRSDADRTR